jgi:hypothetical protein
MASSNKTWLRDHEPEGRMDSTCHQNSNNIRSVADDLAKARISSI